MTKTPSEQVLEERREILRARGVPETLIEKLATRKSGLISASIFGMMLRMVGVLLGGWIGFQAFEYYPFILNRYVEARGFATGSDLFHYARWQEGAILALSFGVMVLPTFLYISLTRKPKPYPDYNYLASCLRADGNGDSYPFRRFFDKLPHDVFEEKLLLKYSYYLLKIMGLWILGPLFAGMIILISGHKHYWGLYDQKIVTHSFGQKTVYDLRDVRSVTLGCNEAKDASALIYEVQFPSKTISLDDGDFGLDRKTLFERLEAIDKMLRQNPDIRFERWQKMKRDPMAAECLKTWAEAIGPNGEARVHKLLSTSKRP